MTTIKKSHSKLIERVECHGHKSECDFVLVNWLAPGGNGIERQLQEREYVVTANFNRESDCRMQCGEGVCRLCLCPGKRVCVLGPPYLRLPAVIIYMVHSDLAVSRTRCLPAGKECQRLSLLCNFYRSNDFSPADPTEFLSCLPQSPASKRHHLFVLSLDMNRQNK